MESIPGLHKGLEILALVGRYDSSVHTRFLAPIIVCFKIPAQDKYRGSLSERCVHVQIIIRVEAVEININGR